MTPEAASGVQWLLVSLPAPPAGEGFRLVDALHRLGAREIWREGDRVLAHLPRPSELEAPEDLGPELRAAVRGATSLPDSALAGDSLTIRPVPAGAIGASERTPPRTVQISARLVIVPAGLHPDSPSDDGLLRLRLHPGGAFGSPAHATTRACLRALDARVRPGDRLIDVGTGSGILAIAAALLGAAQVDAFEADPAACEAARANVRLNRVGDRVRIRHRRVTTAILGRLPPPDGVMANLEPEVLLELLPALAALPRAGGRVLLSGVPRSDLLRVRRAVARPVLTSEGEEIDDGWWTGWFRRV